MQFITDTCFWSHIKEIYDNLSLDIREILEKFRWGMPNSVLKELINRNIDNWIPIDEVYFFPITNTEYQKAIKLYPYLQSLDRTDQDCILIAKRDNLVILTDDGELSITANAMGLSVMEVPDFIVFLSKNRFLEKKPTNQIFTYFKSIGRYKDRELTNWIKKLRLN